MKQSNVDALIKRLARKKASSNIRTGQSESYTRTKRSASFTPAASAFPEIRKGPAPDVVLDLHVCFTELSNVGLPSDAAKQKQVSRKQRSITPQICNHLRNFALSELDEIVAVQPRILSWIGDSDEHAKQFFYDPLQAIKDAGISLSPLLGKKIEQQRSRGADSCFGNPPKMRRARIRSIKVHTCPKGIGLDGRTRDVK